jgi:hypothetical protein
VGFGRSRDGDQTDQREAADRRKSYFSACRHRTLLTEAIAPSRRARAAARCAAFRVLKLHCVLKLSLRPRDSKCSCTHHSLRFLAMIKLSYFKNREIP